MSGSYTHVKTGFGDLDAIFELEGIEQGSIVLVKSVPNANGLNFLLSIAQENLEQVEYITTAHRPEKIKNSLESMGCIRSEIPEATFSGAETGVEDFSALIESLELTEGSVVIVDHIGMFGQMREQDHCKILQLIDDIANQTGSVFILHDLLTSSGGLSTYSSIEYGSDYVFNITKNLTDEGIFQNIWIERLPIGQSIKESKKSTRIVKVDDTLDRISTNAGGRI